MCRTDYFDTFDNLRTDVSEMELLTSEHLFVRQLSRLFDSNLPIVQQM